MRRVHRSQCLRSAAVLFALGLPLAQLHGQDAGCRQPAAHELSPAERAYKDGFYAKAEELYAQDLAKTPQDAGLAAKLIETLLHENKVAQAADQLRAAIEVKPQSAPVLTAQAEVQFRQGEPWLATKSLEAAAAADPCYARVHLVRSQIFHIDSMYASERAELQKAYDIGLTDPDILAGWSRIMPAAQEVEGTLQALATMKDVDADTRAKAENTVHRLSSLLHETSQTCKVLPAEPSATLPLLPSREDGKHVDSYRVDVNLPKGTARLVLDTGTSGLFLSKTIADENGWERAAGEPMGTVRADTFRIGPLEFHDCMVGVSELPFPGKSDGVIGTDLLSSYLITIDPWREKLILDPLPGDSGALPGDRAKSGELADYEPVYHRRQYLLVPVTINDKARKLLVLDTGMRITAMDSDIARAVSSAGTNPLPTKSGQPAQVYRDSFDLQFADLAVPRKSGSILAYSGAAISQNAGFALAGLLGFDVLGQMRIHLDYRDGLVKLEPLDRTASGAKENGSKKAASAEQSAECPRLPEAEIPLNQTLELRVTGTIDSAHLKPGKEIVGEVVNGLVFPGCTLDAKAIVYGHVTAVSASRNPDSAELNVVFDHGDCEGKGKKPLSLHLFALLSPPDQGPNSLHAAVPTQVAGGVRQISTTAAVTNGYDARLSNGGKPPAVHPGQVVGFGGMQLDPVGGPVCSARISSSHRSVQLGPGSELILAVAQPSAADRNP